MYTALRKRLIVRPGGVIEVRSPELTVGSMAEVIVIVEAPGAGVLVPSESSVGVQASKDLGWPPAFFERIAGSIPDFPEIEPEGDYEVRDELL